MKLFKILIAAGFVIYLAVYLFVPYIVTTRDFGPDMAGSVSLGGFVWGGDQVSHISRYVQDNLRHSVPLRGLTRDMFVTGVVWPVVGMILLVLLLGMKDLKSALFPAVMLCIWGLWGGLYFFTDPVLNIGGAAYWLITGLLFALGAAAGGYLYYLIKTIRKGGATK